MGGPNLSEESIVGGGGEWQEVGKEPEEGREGELGLVCKIKNN